MSQSTTSIPFRSSAPWSVRPMADSEAVAFHIFHGSRCEAEASPCYTVLDDPAGHDVWSLVTDHILRSRGIII